MPAPAARLAEPLGFFQRQLRCLECRNFTDIDEEAKYLAACDIGHVVRQDVAATSINIGYSTFEILFVPCQRRMGVHREGFDDTVWFRMDIGRRHNAD
ncbi:MAG: hypothetical protein O9331_13390, partial [Acidovorax sp.]|nr:hypothetical protein [Acidovorax sp.]